MKKLTKNSVLGCVEATGRFTGKVVRSTSRIGSGSVKATKSTWNFMKESGSAFKKGWKRGQENKDQKIEEGTINPQEEEK